MRNTVWITADMHYTAAHYYDPNRAVFQDFEPFWEFVSGPLHAGTWGPGELDNTFGPQVMYQNGCSAEQGENLAPCFGLQFFGHVEIDGATEVMTVTLKDVDDRDLWSTRIEPKLLRWTGGLVTAAHLIHAGMTAQDFAGTIELSRMRPKPRRRHALRMKPMRLLSAAAAVLLAATAANAQTIYPIDRAEILSGARFDFKVEFPGKLAPDQVKVTVNGADYVAAFGKAADLHRARGRQGPVGAHPARRRAAEARHLSGAGEDGTNSREVTWTVYDTGPRQAKNVILFIGDGLSLAHRVAARLLSKGIAEGKANGKLAIDDMPHMALVATAGSDSIITDSANSASAYATGHKSAVNAMGVYADRTESPFDDPKVETITSLVKRRLGMAVGIVTNTEIEDATPAAMIAHTRRRATYRPDRRAVLCGEARRADGRRLGELPAGRRARRAAQGRRRLHREIPRRRLCRGARPRPEMTAAAKPPAQPGCSACSTPATWTACSTANSSRAAR